MAEIGWKDMIERQEAKSRNIDARSKSRKHFFPSSLPLAARFLLLRFSASLFLASTVYACPMCTELIEHGKDAFGAWRFGQGIAWSILLMFAVPVCLVGGMTFFIVRSYRRTLQPGPDQDVSKS